MYNNHYMYTGMRTYVYLCIMMQNGCTPLHLAAQNGHTTVVDMLLKNGADINVLNTVRKLCVLM